ncbi:protein of unknown function [Cyanobium sp. NIES-981]|nr:protein of unknown function [Cyanobium sp. NIES-981]
MWVKGCASQFQKLEGDVHAFIFCKQSQLIDWGRLSLINRLTTRQVKVDSVGPRVWKFEL